MAIKNVAATPVTWGVGDGRAAEVRSREIISDAPVCVRFDPATGKFRDEPVIEGQDTPVLFTWAASPQG